MAIFYIYPSYYEFLNFGLEKKEFSGRQFANKTLKDIRNS